MASMARHSQQHGLHTMWCRLVALSESTVCVWQMLISLLAPAIHGRVAAVASPWDH